MVNNNQSNKGIGFVGILTLIFITLKLLGKITWSWLWVLSPIWISFVVGLSIVSIIIIFMATIESIKNLKK